MPPTIPDVACDYDITCRLTAQAERVGERITRGKDRRASRIKEDPGIIRSCDPQPGLIIFGDSHRHFPQARQPVVTATGGCRAMADGDHAAAVHGALKIRAAVVGAQDARAAVDEVGPRRHRHLLRCVPVRGGEGQCRRGYHDQYRDLARKRGHYRHRRPRTGGGTESDCVGLCVCVLWLVSFGKIQGRPQHHQPRSRSPRLRPPLGDKDPL